MQKQHQKFVFNCVGEGGFLFFGKKSLIDPLNKKIEWKKEGNDFELEIGKHKITFSTNHKRDWNDVDMRLTISNYKWKDISAFKSEKIWFVCSTITFRNGNFFEMSCMDHKKHRMEISATLSEAIPIIEKHLGMKNGEFAAIFKNSNLPDEEKKYIRELLESGSPAECGQKDL